MILSMPLRLLVVIIIITFQFLKTLRQHVQLSKFKKANGCGSPQQTPRILLGLPQIIQLIRALRHNQFLDYVQGLFSKYGTTFAYNTFGTQSIWTMEPENIQACLVTQAQDFEAGASRHKVLIPLVGHSVLTTDGSLWSHHRAMMRRNFVKTELLNLDIFEKHFLNLLRCMPHDASTIELRDLLQKLTMDISSDFLLGHSTNSLDLHATQNEDEFSQAWSTALSWIPLRAHLGSLMDWIPHPSFFRACKTIHAYADELVVMALAAKSQPEYKTRYIFLHAVAEEITDPVQLRDHTLSIICAGRDTTAEVLSCTVNILSKNHGVLLLLRQEICRLNGQKPSFENIKEMKYLRNVILEVLRLYPVGPVNARIATKNTTLPLGGGPDGMSPVMIQKGQQVMYSIYGMHRRKDLYGPDAEDFRPERWENRRQGGDFLPFNSGARSCLGQTFAMAEASYILVRLLQEFDIIESRGSKPWQENLGLILSNLHGTLLGMIKSPEAERRTVDQFYRLEDVLVRNEDNAR